MQYTKDGTIIVTDDLKGKEKVSMQAMFKPNAVVESVSHHMGRIDRMIYDGQGRQLTQISNGAHGNLEKHLYGVKGEHAHDIVWSEKEIVDRPTIELNDKERKEHADIL